MSTLEILTDQLHATSLPTGWRWSSLSDLLVCMESGSRPKGGAVGINGGVPSISAEHMTPHGTFDFSVLRYVPRDYYDNMPRGHIRRGDILIVKDGATTGKTCFVDDSFPFDEAVGNEHVFICRADAQQMLPELLFLWLWGPQGQCGIRSSYQGAAIGGINQSFASALQVPVPPSHQQGDMLRRLRNAFSKIAAARDALRQRQEASTALACAWHRDAFEQLRKASVPEVALGNIVEFLTARSLASDGDAPVHAVTTACLSEVGFLSEGIKEGRMRSVDVASCTIRPGEILIARSNTPELVGRVSLYEGVPSPIVATDLTVRMRCVDGAAPEYVTAYLSFLYQTGYWREVAGGASGSMKKITRAHLQRLPVPLPNVPEQVALAESLHDKVVATRAIQGRVADEGEALSALPSAVIRRAFKGVD